MNYNDIVEKARAMNVEPMSAIEYEKKRVEWANADEGKLNLCDGVNCPKCKNKGIIYVIGDNNFMACRECDCMKRRRTLERARKSGLGNVLHDYTFNKFNATENWQKVIKDSAMKFCTSRTDEWFYIGGAKGCGKTHICTAICGQLIKQGKDCRYMLWRDESTKLKQLINDSKQYQRRMHELKTVDVLYIDDLFKTQNGQEPSKGDVNLAFEIINKRLFNNDLITIISSEYTLIEALRIDEGTISRVFKKCGEYRISVEAEGYEKNYRLRGITDD